MPAAAQQQRETERRLEKIRTELKDVARDRRRLEGERGDAARQLRDADEQVGTTSRSLAETESSLRREQAALAELQGRRTGLQAGLAQQKQVLAALLRSAYTGGNDAPLKVLLAQDSVAEANRRMAYHGYLQRDRAARMQSIDAELAELQSLEVRIATRQASLEAARARQKRQVVTLQGDRQKRMGVIARLDEQYEDRASREKALGQDAKALESLIANLRAAAARAEAERRAAARREAAEQARIAKAEREPRPVGATKPPPRATRSPVISTAPAIKVGGLGWPVSGNLLAGFGGRMPDGRSSSGVLIGAPVGSTVSAAADGTVVFSEWMTGYGLILIVDHGNGTMSLYAHNESLLHDAGDVVKRGDPVARVGNSGGQGQPALYFELRRNGQPVDPSSWLQRR